VRILLADDHVMFRDGMTYIIKDLDPEAEIATASDFDGVMAMLEKGFAPDLLLLDLNMPGIGWEHVVARALKRTAALRIVIVSASDDHEEIIKALNAGVVGFIQKTSPAKVLQNALKLVLSGGAYIPPVLLEMRGKPAQLALKERGPLTPRQAMILSELKKGRANKEISRSLRVSEGTVKLDIAKMMKLFNASNRTQLVVSSNEIGNVEAAEAALPLFAWDPAHHP
jgi:DNA-binding NarL/FixJ family response regulator